MKYYLLWSNIIDSFLQDLRIVLDNNSLTEIRSMEIQYLFYSESNTNYRINQNKNLSHYRSIKHKKKKKKKKKNPTTPEQFENPHFSKPRFTSTQFSHLSIASTNNKTKHWIQTKPKDKHRPRRPDTREQPRDRPELRRQPARRTFRPWETSRYGRRGTGAQPSETWTRTSRPWACLGHLSSNQKCSFWDQRNPRKKNWKRRSKMVVLMFLCDGCLAWTLGEVN